MVTLVMAVETNVASVASARPLAVGRNTIILLVSNFSSAAFGRMMPILILNTGGVALQTLVTWLLVSRGFSIESLVALAVVIQALQVAAGWLIYARSLPIALEKSRIDFAYVRRLTRAGIPF